MAYILHCYFSRILSNSAYVYRLSFSSQVRAQPCRAAGTPLVCELGRGRKKYILGCCQIHLIRTLPWCQQRWNSSQVSRTQIHPELSELHAERVPREDVGGRCPIRESGMEFSIFVICLLTRAGIGEFISVESLRIWVESLMPPSMANPFVPSNKSWIILFP